MEKCLKKHYNKMENQLFKLNKIKRKNNIIKRKKKKIKKII